MQVKFLVHEALGNNQFFFYAEYYSDYAVFRRIFRFSECDKSACLFVHIFDDDIVEVQESFDLTLERLPGVNSYLILEPNRTTITIEDIDGE